MCVICLLSVVGCGQTKADTNTPSAANQQTVTDDYLTTISRDVCGAVPGAVEGGLPEHLA